MSKSMALVAIFSWGTLFFVVGFAVGESSMKDRALAAEKQRYEMIGRLNESTETLNRSIETLNRCNQALRGAQ